jgi:hypothetical protein
VHRTLFSACSIVCLIRRRNGISCCSLVLVNVIGRQIDWDPVELRDMAIGELFRKLERDLLQLGKPDVGVAGHG